MFKLDRNLSYAVVEWGDKEVIMSNESPIIVPSEVKSLSIKAVPLCGRGDVFTLQFESPGELTELYSSVCLCNVSEIIESAPLLRRCRVFLPEYTWFVFPSYAGELELSLSSGNYDLRAVPHNVVIKNEYPDDYPQTLWLPDGFEGAVQAHSIICDSEKIVADCVVLVNKFYTLSRCTRRSTVQEIEGRGRTITEYLGIKCAKKASNCDPQES